MTTRRAQVGIIGGSGLYEMKAVEGARPVKVRTPFGEHSGPLLLGRLSGVDCAFLPRHGKGHVRLPSEVNPQANIYALKALGVERIISIGAVGSLKEELAPRDFVIPDQLVDGTKGRNQTFFGKGVVAHVAFADPFCQSQSSLIFDAAQGLGVKIHQGGVLIVMEGPAFSTRAESEFHRKMGYSIIGMTALPEAKLAREAELCYTLVALVTDYDCWKEGEEVSTELVVGNLLANVANAQKLLIRAVPKVAALPRSCPCAKALDGAIFTAPAALNKATARKLDLLIGHRLRK